MVNQAERENQVESAEVGVEGRRIADPKLRAITERVSRLGDVLLAHVDTDVVDLSEVRDKFSRPAPEVEHSRSRRRPHMLTDESAAPVLPADEPGPRLVHPRYS